MSTSTIDETHLDERIRYLTAVNVFSRMVHGTPNLDAILEVASQETRRLLGALHTGIFLSTRYRVDSAAADLLSAMTERVSAGQDVVEVTDVRTDPRLADLVARALDSGIVAFCDLPLRAQDRLLGHWAVYFGTPGPLKADELEMYQHCAEHLAAALLNAQLMEELFSRTQRLSVTYEISRELNSRLELAQVLRGILEMSALSVKADTGSLVAFDETRRTLAAWEFKEGQLYEIATARIERFVQVGLAGWVLRHRQSAQIADTSRDARWLHKPGAKPRSALCLPLLYSNEVVGVMTLTHPEVNGLTYDDLELLGAVADQAALAVQNARLYRSASARAQQLAVLNEVSRSVSSTLDLESVLELIMTKTLEILGAEAGSLILVEGPQRDLVFRVTRGAHSSQVAGLRLPWGAGLTGKVAEDGQPIISNDVRNDPRWLGRVDDAGFMRAMMILPLTSRDTVIGVLTVINKRDGSGFTTEDIELISSFAGQAAIALENARLFSNTDEALARRVDELHALQVITREIASTLDLRQVIDVLLSRALAVTRAPRGLVALTAEGVATLGVVASSGFAADGPAAVRNTLPIERGVIGRVIREVLPLLVGDVSKEADYWDLADGLTRTQLCVPIIYERTVLGVIDVEADGVDALNEGHVNFLAQLADHAALAIQNARLHRETEKQLDNTTRANRRIRALQNALAAVQQSALDLDEVLQRIGDAVLSLGYESVFLAQYLEGEKTLEIRALSSTVPDLIQSMESLFGQPFLGMRHTLTQMENIGVRSFSDGHALVSSNLADFWAPLGIPAEVTDMDLLWHGASLPLRTHDRPVGNMFVFTLQKEFSSEDLALLQSFADQAGVALDKARLFTEVNRVRDRLQIVLNSVRDAIATFSTAGRLILGNPAVHGLLGIDLEPYTRTGGSATLSFDELQERLGVTDTLESINVARQQEPLAVIRRTFHLDLPPRRYFEESIVPIYNLPEGAEAVQAGAPLLGWLVVWHDVTNQKELEQTREEFTHMLVHDLRSPLGAVIGGLSVAQELLEEPDILDTGMLGETVNLALDGSRHLLELINSILDINKLESGSMPLELKPLKMAELAEDVVRTLLATAERTNIHLTSEVSSDLPLVLGDYEKIHRVATNLVGNSLKFTPSGKGITVRAAVEEGRMRVMIADQGPGIPPEYRTRIFEKFVQVPGSKGRQKGTGLGLTFCRLTVEAHGGKIWVDCPPEGGSVFSFTLSLAG